MEKKIAVLSSIFIALTLSQATSAATHKHDAYKDLYKEVCTSYEQTLFKQPNHFCEKWKPHDKELIKWLKSFKQLSAARKTVKDSELSNPRQVQ